MTIPEVKFDILGPLIEEINGPNGPKWLDDITAQLMIEQPVIAQYLSDARERYGEQAALTGMLVFRMIESQMEAAALEDLFDDS